MAQRSSSERSRDAEHVATKDMSGPGWLFTAEQYLFTARAAYQIMHWWNRC